MASRPRVRLTNADKVLYPAAGTAAAVTKRDVFDYYTRIAPVLLPHLDGRPVTRKRWPDGVRGESFFEKQLASSAPDWLNRAVLQHRSGPTSYPIIDSVDALAWIAQQAALEVHVPQWRFVDGKPGPATRLVFDLDPGDGVTLYRVAEVARAIRDLVADIGLSLFPVTSGSKGLHLYAALPEPMPSDDAVTLAKRVALELQNAMPQLVTATMAKNLRAGKVFVDWSQNNAAKTTVSPYSLRGREQPTVAAPRTWAELDDPGLRQLRYEEVLERVERDGDLLAELDRTAPQPAAGFAFDELSPMLATAGSVARLDPARWAFEGKWDGYRLLVDANRGVLRLRSRSGRDVTGEYPQLRSVIEELAEHHAVLDGEVVALDNTGTPSFAELQNRARATRVEFWAFDILFLDGRPLLRAAYRDRRQLLETLAAGTALVVPDLLSGTGAEALSQAARLGWEGVVAKNWAAGYRPGRRSPAWIKQKHWKTQEIVIGGFHGGPAREVGSLLMGIPAGGKLTFAGRVGTGFTDRELAHLTRVLAPLRTGESPFDPALPGADARGVTFVRPELVGEVRYREWTTGGRLRHPSWRGLRPDKAPREVVREE